LAKHVQTDGRIAAELWWFDAHPRPCLFDQVHEGLELRTVLAIPDVSKQAVTTASASPLTYVLIPRDLFFFLERTESGYDRDVNGIALDELRGRYDCPNIHVKAKATRRLLVEK
jgi:hypothetical protein